MLLAPILLLVTIALLSGVVKSNASICKQFGAHFPSHSNSISLNSRHGQLDEHISPPILPIPKSIMKMQNILLPVSSSSMYQLLSLRAGSTKYKIAEKSEKSVVSLSPMDTERKNLLRLSRFIYLTYYASMGALMPYLPVYYHSLGHGGQAIGLLGAVKPLTTFVVAPIWGLISDISSSPVTVLQFTFVSSLILQLMIPLKNDVKYLVGAVFLTALINAPVKSLIDSIIINKLSSSDKGQYGKLRLWGQLGFGLGSSSVGLFLSRIASNANGDKAIMDKIVKVSLSSVIYTVLEKLKNINGYHIAFLAHGILSIPVFFCINSFAKMAKLDPSSRPISQTKNSKNDKMKEKSSQILLGLKVLLNNNEALLFFFLVFVVGVSSGIIENFAYVRIKEVGGTGVEMGFSRLVSSSAGVPMFWHSSWITEKLGVEKVYLLSLLSFVARFFIYASMKKPYHGLPAEALRGATFAAFWTSGTVYAHKISPPGMSTTMLMILNAMYGGLGQSAGALIGGKLQSKVGTVKTFLYSGTFNLFFVIILMLYLSLKNGSSLMNPPPIRASK